MLRLIPKGSEYIESAENYRAGRSTWVVTCYYNPCRYLTKRVLYDRFIQSLEISGIPYLVIECAFGEEEFELAASSRVMQVRAGSVMWQKERLLNLAIHALPDDCDKVVWADADLLFENPDWLVETEALLDRYAIVQPFDMAVRLPRGASEYVGDGEVYDSFGKVYLRDPNQLLSGRFELHGHTGFVWAGRREVIQKHGLYDACISGSGDHMMSHAFVGDWDSECVRRIFAGNQAHFGHFRRWSAGVYEDVRGLVGFVEGAVLHLWHGEQANRRYVLRNQELAELGFDPDRHLKVGLSGCWEWGVERERFQTWAVEYFSQRLEDGQDVEGEVRI